jgi:PAS domain S-box-containing protein
MARYRSPLISVLRPAGFVPGSLRGASLFGGIGAARDADMSQLCRALVSSSPDCIEILDPEGCWEFINERGLELLEIEDFAAFAGRRWTESFPEAVRCEAEDALAVARSGEVARFQTLCPTQKGAVKWWDVLVTPVFGPDGGIQRLVCASRDITDIKASEAKLGAALAELEAASRAKDDFLANLSHELRTPLTSILGFSEHLRMEGRLDADVVAKVGRIEKAGQGLLALVNDMLDLARAGAGTLRVEPAPCDVRSVLDHVGELTGPLASAKALALHIEADAEIEGWFELDEKRLRQILLNLVNNAIKFTEAGRITVRLCVLQDAGREWLAFAVADTGSGIPADCLPTLFDRFTQVDGSVRRQHGGAGLGLAISRELAERMGGAIGVESVLGQGSTFWFRLPMDRVEGPAACARPVLDPSGPPLRILAADDSEANRQLLTLILEACGHEVRLAHDGAEALACLASETFDLVLMDIQMPRLDGLSAIRALRGMTNANARKPVLAITANVFPEQVASYLAAGADDCLSKPFQVADVLEKVARWGMAARLAAEEAWAAA